MTTALPDPLSISFRGASFSATLAVHNSHDVLKSPNVDDISDLAKQVQEITDILSRLLLNESKWREALSFEHRKVLQSSVEQFRNLCEDAAVLLQLFFNSSQRFATLFKAISESECYSEIRNVAVTLRSELESIFTRMCSVERQYGDFIPQIKKLMHISPHHLTRRDCDKDLEVFHRLEGFWKVVGTQLSSVLECGFEPRYADTSREARNRWLEYKGCLIGAISALKESSDAISASASDLREDHGKRGMSLSGYVKIGFFAFWSKLRGRRVA